MSGMQYAAITSGSIQMTGPEHFRSRLPVRRLDATKTASRPMLYAEIPESAVTTTESSAARFAAERSAYLLGIREPTIHYFVGEEDLRARLPEAHPFYERPWIMGFSANGVMPDDLMVRVGRRAIADIMRTTFHEARHLWQGSPLPGITPDMREDDAYDFADRALASLGLGPYAFEALT